METISFISCVSDEGLYKQCLAHIHQLIVPQETRIETIPIRGAKSMTEGYNQGKKKSNGRFKVYLHQDAFIINPTFLFDLLYLFETNPRLGLFGVIGSIKLPSHGMWWNTPITNKVGKIIEARETFSQTSCTEATYMYEKAEAVDGLLLATQYDIDWLERFNGWHFYDVSQCLLFQQHGYDVGVAHQVCPWVIHYCKKSTMANYYEALPDFQAWREEQNC
ncbi:hypothetical protein JOC54_001798 [Alkalihalobacillus xiaoxiensis]|uniref:Streptomycin biosynthesis protein StrF domain-containing protein n=1 Tax=Shouchella xiaoxiensis TaxID=766895 RepID=A0ABS2SWC4_9BACI|nr:glycosyltransferase family protein [Shouchella xiaoxiensis]MBM7838542.1 hypothetical protein [Shouchella xiaoxiensis]